VEWTALPFDGNPRALLHNVARAYVFSPVGRWRAWAVPSWAAPVRYASACAGVVGWAGALAWAIELEITFLFSVNSCIFIQY